MSINAPHNNPLASPTFSVTSEASSYDLLSLSCSATNISAVSNQDTESDDVIVWGTSVSPSMNGDGPVSDDDFVVLARPRFGGETGLSTPDAEDRPETPSVEKLTWCLTSLTVKTEPSTFQGPTAPPAKAGCPSGAARRKRKKVAAVASQTDTSAYPSPSPSPPPERSLHETTPRALRRRARNAKKRAADGGFGCRTPVDDMSERASVVGEDINVDTAARFITRFLSSPSQSKDKSERLTLLQSLIIELGLATASNALPTSLTAAKALIKSRAFVNIREYLAVRTQGPTAIRNILFSSKSALIKDIRRKHNTAPLGMVKKAGLQVLLVPSYSR